MRDTDAFPGVSHPNTPVSFRARSLAPSLEIFMPQFVHGPELTALNCELTPPQTAAVLSLLHAIPAPPHRPALGRVLLNAVGCCQTTVGHMSSVPAEVVELMRHLESAAKVIGNTPALDAEVLMRGQRTRFPEWNCFALMDASSPREIQILAGAGLMKAMSLDQPLESKIAKRVDELLRRTADEERPYALEAAKSYASKLLIDVAGWTQSTRAASKQALLRTRILASLAGQIDAPNLDDRRACSPAREATPQECLEAAPILRRLAEEGDGLALAIVIAHCSGPTWDTVLDFPFADFAPDDWAARIDVRAGIVQIDLGSVLSDLASALPGHEVASGIQQIPLPEFAAQALQRAIASQPEFTCLRELFGLEKVTSRTVLPGMPADAAIPLTIARFVHARGSFAIWCGVDRGVAAYGTGDPVKVGKSSHHYLTFTLDEIWSGNARRYASLQWGEPARNPSTRRTSIGSLATPTEQTMRRIDATFVDAVRNAPIGRSYTWKSLRAHHNAFARLCAHRASFFTLARHAAKFAFFADTVHEDYASCLLVDKRVGPFQGAIELPMSVRFAQQLQLWKCHLVALRGRIMRLKEKNQIDGGEAVIRRIDAILLGRHEPLFFLLTDQGNLQEFGSEELLAQHPDIPLKGDGRRHYLINALRHASVPFSLVTAQARHHVDALSLNDLCAQVPILVALEHLARALDRIAFDLGMDPVAGLSRKEVRDGAAA